MKEKTERAKNVSAILSRIRDGYSKKAINSFTKKEFIASLKEHKCSYPVFVLDSLIQSGNIVLIGKKEGYTFKSKDPIFYGSFAKILETKIQNHDLYVKKFRKKENVSQKADDVEKMISFLKERGYKIYKPITTFEEI